MITNKAHEALRWLVAIPVSQGVHKNQGMTAFGQTDYQLRRQVANHVSDPQYLPMCTCMRAGLA